MIALGMRVQIRRGGAAIPVERLEIGDLIYDPLRDNYLEICDLLSRESGPPGHALIRIAAGAQGPGRPARDLLVSPQQPVATVAPQPAELSRPEVRLVPATRVGTPFRQPTRLFVVIPERTGFACVEGMVVALRDGAELFGEPRAP